MKISSFRFRIPFPDESDASRGDSQRLHLRAAGADIVPHRAAPLAGPIAVHDVLPTEGAVPRVQHRPTPELRRPHRTKYFRVRDLHSHIC